MLAAAPNYKCANAKRTKTCKKKTAKKERLDALDAQKDELTAKITDKKLKKPGFNEHFIRSWRLKAGKRDMSQQKRHKAWIKIFVGCVEYSLQS